MPEQAVSADAQNDDFTVRYFEQEQGNRKELGHETEFSTSLNEIGPSEMTSSLNQLEAALKTPQEKAALSDVIKQMSGLWGGVRSQADMDAVSAQMESQSKRIDKEIEEATEGLPASIMKNLTASLKQFGLDADEPLTESTSLTIPEIPTNTWTLNQRRKVSKLNAAIYHACVEKRRMSAFSQSSVSAVYRAYHAARLGLARSWSHVPIDVWDFLWSVFNTEESGNPHRLTHLSLLARDMSDANVDLSPAQQIVTIEAVFVDGWEARAMENWKRNVTTLGGKKAETFKDFWELGVRMHCHMGNLEAAERASAKLLERRMDARILMPIIHAYCKQNTPESRAKGWEKYRQMRELLGKSMNLNDYDQVIANFLTHGNTESALYAFVDMMSDGQIDLSKQRYMPSVIANKFFVGKWLKRLIGAGDLDGAYSVVKFMLAKGVQASPVQLNGLIGAWQRSGTAANMEKAEELGWNMIESRVAFVKARENKTLQHTPTSRNEPAQYPRATLETFCILAENFRLRDLQDRQEELWALFRDAQISPDAFMMNQLLETHIQAGKHAEALDLYHNFVAESGVQPDPHTFSALWKTIAVNRLYVITPEDAGNYIPETRQLFADMVEARAVFGSQGAHYQLARKILHSFRRLNDFPGLLIAQAALKEVFGFSLSDILVLELAIGTHKLSSDTPALRRALMIAKRDMEFSLLKWAGNDPAKLEGAGRSEALHAYLQKIFTDEIGSDKEAKKILLRVAKEMGVLELLPAKKGGIV